MKRNLIELRQWTAPSHDDFQAATEAFWRLEEFGYRSLQRSVLRSIAQVVNDADDGELLRYVRRPSGGTYATETIADDILLPDRPGLAFHLALEKGMLASVAVRASAVFDADEPDVGERIDRFLEHASVVLQQTGVLSESAKFEESSLARERCTKFLDEFPELIRAPAPSKEVIDAAFLLTDKNIRDLIIDVNTKDVAYRDDILAGKGYKNPADAGVLQALFDRGLLESEVVVLCKKTSKVVLRAKSENELEGITPTCRCGASIAEERKVEAVASTPLANSLVLKSRWMQTLATTALMVLGLSRDDIRVPKSDARDDPVDLVFCWDGFCFVVEMTDGDFVGLDGIKFGARLRKFPHADRGLILATGKIGSDARDEIQDIISAAPAMPPLLGGLSGQTSKLCHFLDGPRCVTNDLTSLLRAFRRVTVATQFELHAAGGIDVIEVLKQWLEKPADATDDAHLAEDKTEGKAR